MCQRFLSKMGYIIRRTWFTIKKSCVLWVIVFAVCFLIILFQADETISRSIENINRSDVSLEMDEILDINQLNVTGNAEIDILLFNRVPKVGSRTMLELLKRLSKENGFVNHFETTLQYDKVRLNETEQKNLAAQIVDFGPLSTYARHVGFVDFTKFDYAKPIYINVVRDPVERVISWFYYVRTSWHLVVRQTLFPGERLPDPEWLKKDLEICVLTGDPECLYIQDECDHISDHRRQTLFFCGNDKDCLPFNSQSALDKSIKHVEENFAVVGVLEELDMTMTVFEHYLPKFFKNATNIFNDMKSIKINDNPMKGHVSEHVKDILRQKFSREMEFYNYCKSRLHKQYHALKQLGIVTDQH